MSRINVFFVAALSAATAFGQENYSQWSHYKNITVNTTNGGGGANVAGGVGKFPLLVRLDSAGAAEVFSGARAGGADIRFTRSDGTTRLPHEREQWDSAGKRASFWVLVDTIRGNSSQNIRMYWGNASAADSSNGKAVFDTANKFQAVFHLNRASGNDTDATSNGFVAAPVGGAIQDSSTADPGNFISGGRFKDFGGVGGYRLATSAGGSTNDALHFLNSSLYMLSAWVKVTAFPASNTVRQGIVSKCQNCLTTNPTNVEWAMRALDVSRFDVYNVATGSAPSPVITAASPNTGVWTYVTYVRSAPNSQTLRVYSSSNPNGLVNTSTSSGVPVSQNIPVMIGAFAGDSAGTGIGFFNGKIDEVVISGVNRDTNWIRLSYHTQKPGATAVTVGPTRVPGGPDIVTDPQDAGAPAGGTVRFTVVATGNAPLTFRWVRRDTDTVGTNSDTLTLTNVSSADTGSYKVVVRNSLGVAVSGPARMTLILPPVISSQPVSQTVNVGSVARFSVAATGTAPFTFKWVRRNVDTVRTATGSGPDTLTLSNVAMTDTGSYKCVVSNPAGQVVSNPATLGATVGIVASRGGKGSMDWRISGGEVIFRVPEHLSFARISILDASGRAVWEEKGSPGARELTWKGEDARGRKVPAGVYLARALLQDGNQRSLGAAEMRIIYGP